MELYSILVVIDPTSGDSQPSLDRARWVAKRSKAKLELFICDFNSALDGGYFFEGPAQQKTRDSLLERHTEWLEELAQPLREEGITVNTETRWGKPLHTMILQRVDELKPDLVIRDAHTHNLFQRLFFNNTSWQLIRKCPVALWLPRGGEWKGERVCAAVDPVHASDSTAALDHLIVQTTGYIEQTLGMQADYIHSYAPLPRTMVFDSELVAAYDQYLERSEKQHREAFEDLLVDYSLADSQRHLLKGFPEETIPKFVEEHEIDLLVMGAVSRSNLENALIGNTAERVLEAAQTDLLVIRAQTAKQK